MIRVQRKKPKLKEAEAFLEKQLFSNLHMLGFEEYQKTIIKPVELEDGIFALTNMEASLEIFRFLINKIEKASR